jgi:signal transduction histidine kinase
MRGVLRRRRPLAWAALAVPIVASWEVFGGPLPNLAALAALAAALAICPVYPGPALAAAFALPLINTNFVFALPVVSYLAGHRAAGARRVGWAFTGICAAGAALHLLRGTALTSWFPLTVYLVLLGVAPWLAGRAVRQYVELVRAGWQRADQLERERHIVAERERLRERARIARDMHDSLGHDLSLIALHAGALEVAPGLGADQRAAAGLLRERATAATGRLAEIIGVLGDSAEPAPRHPAGPSLAEVADLIGDARRSGMTIIYRPGPADPGPVPPMVGHAVYRIVQEALTNAAKHAPGAPVTVRLVRCRAATAVTVTNPRPPGGPLPGRVQGRRGLTGLAERARLTGGTLTAAATPGGGFTLTADLPHGEPAQPPAALPGPGDGLGATVSARLLAERRRTLRRRLVTVVVAPAALLAVLGVLMLGYYVHATVNSVLDPADYRALTVGQTRAQVARVLPPRQWLGGGAGPAGRAERPPPPPGTACLRYRPDANLLGLSRIYRLCFAGDRLAAKDIVPTTPGEQ